MAEQRPLDAVVFDFGGVLSTSPFLLMPQVEAAFGLMPGSLGRLLGYAIDEPEPEPGAEYTNPWHLLEVGRIPFSDYLAWVRDREVEVLGPGAPSLREMMGSLGGVRGLGAQWMVVQRAVALREEGVRTAICTNNVRELSSDWRSMIPVEAFDVVVDSSEVGLRKPDPRIYRLTCQRLRVEPGRTAFLDDHPGNVAAARGLGMVGIHVGPDPWAALAELDAALAPQVRWTLSPGNRT